MRPKASDNDIRLAFEGFALDSEATDKYRGKSFDSPERYKHTVKYRKRGPLSGVKPEAVSSVVLEVSAPLEYGPPQQIPFLNSAFWDAKAKRSNKKISLSSDDYQTQGYLDYLSHYSPAAAASLPRNAHPNPALIYVTTADVGITKGVLDYTGETLGPGVPFTPVIIYQKVACLRNTNGQFTENYLQMGWGIPLNAYRSHLTSIHLIAV